MVKPDPAGRTNTVSSRNTFSLFSHTHTPTSKWTLFIGTSGSGQAEHNPNISVFIMAGTKRIFVIISIDSPVIGNGFKDIGTPVTIPVFHPGNFGSLGCIKPAVFP